MMSAQRCFPALLLFCFAALSVQSYAQDFIPLWPEHKMPNSKGMHLKDSIANERIYQVGTPGMYAYFPSKQENKGTAVVICPGGGYARLAYMISGVQLAKWFNTMGVSAFVLNYRLPTSPDLVEPEKGPLQDAQRALRMIRAKAKEWMIFPDKIGIQGSSAGGHLASLTATTTTDVAAIGDSLDTYSCKPNFMILVSPVIDMGNVAHKGSKENLLGNNPSAEKIAAYSTQLLVTATTPPAFVTCAFDDNVVPPVNSILFYEALLDKKVSSTLHIFPHGKHAIALRNNPGSTDEWTILCEKWMMEMNLLRDKPLEMK
jgi:acetyl esterase/lipase